MQAGIARAENGMEEASSDTDRNMTVFFGLRSIGPPGLTFLTSRHPMFDVHISGRDIQIIYGIAAHSLSSASSDAFLLKYGHSSQTMLDS